MRRIAHSTALRRAIMAAELKGRPPRAVRGRAALGEERDRLWARWRELGGDVDGYATRRSRETAVVVLEPAPE